MYESDVHLFFYFWETSLFVDKARITKPPPTYTYIPPFWNSSLFGEEAFELIGYKT